MPLLSTYAVLCCVVLSWLRAALTWRRWRPWLVVRRGAARLPAELRRLRSACRAAGPPPPAADAAARAEKFETAER